MSCVVLNQEGDAVVATAPSGEEKNKTARAEDRSFHMRAISHRDAFRRLRSDASFVFPFVLFTFDANGAAVSGEVR